MKILFLAPRVPLPADTGGKIRTLNILKQLALEHDVHLACFTFEENDQDLVKELEELGIEITLVPMKQSSLLRKVMDVCFHPLPVSLAKYNTPRMAKTVKQLLTKNQFDAVHVDHLHMAHYIRLLHNIPCMLDEHNVEYKILERCGQVEKLPVKRMAYRNQTVKMWEFEADTVQKFQCVFACSLDDRILLNKMSSGLVPIYVIPNGVDTEYFQPNKNPDQVQEDALVFTGSMDWLPNDDAITYFCSEILPLIWKRKADVKVYVVGKSPSPSVKELASKDPRVIVTGRVDDVRPYIDRSKLFIVPLRIGGGTRLKILEAMAMNKAVVSTTIGAEGIEHTSGVNIALADHPEQFAQRVVDLLGQPAKIKSMGEEGRKLVCQKYDWFVVGNTLNRIYREAIHALSK